jgi:hypothetical protein
MGFLAAAGWSLAILVVGGADIESLFAQGRAQPVPGHHTPPFSPGQAGPGILATPQTTVRPQRRGPQSHHKDLVALTVPAGEHAEYVALVDPVSRVMSVYAIDPDTGEIRLKSVRNVSWDLQMDEFKL